MATVPQLYEAFSQRGYLDKAYVSQEEFHGALKQGNLHHRGHKSFNPFLQKTDRKIGDPAAKTHIGTFQVIRRITAEKQAQNAQSLESKVGTLSNQLSTQTTQNIALQNQVSSQNQNVIQQRARIENLQQQIRELEATIATLNAQVEAIPSLQQQITSLESQVAALRLTLSELLNALT